MADVARGAVEAAEELFVRYAERLTRLAEQHLSRRLAARVDGEDVVQSAFRTFYRRAAGGKLNIDNSAELWRLLVKITLRKVAAAARRHTAGVRDAGAQTADNADLASAAARDPGPAEAAALVDQIDAILQGLPEMYGQLLELRLQGYSADEIAPRLRVSRRTVYRSLELLQERLEQQNAEA
jgi:RNA polymerase sigma factor (sigma-70 family)